MNIILEFIYCLCMISQFFVCLLTPIASGTLLTIAVYTIHFGAIISGVIMLYLHKRSIKIEYVLLPILCVLLILLLPGTNYNSFVKTVCFIEMIIAPQLGLHVGLYGKKRTSVITCCCVVLTAFAFIYQYSLDLETYYKVYFLGLNKNFSGFLLLLTFNACIITSFIPKKKLFKMGFYVVAGIMCALIVISRCRTAELALIIEIVLFFFGRKFLFSSGFRRILFIFPLVVMAILLIFPNINSLRVLGGTSSILDGREKLFRDYLDNVGNWIVFGNINKYAFENAHNGPMSIMISIGVIGWYLWYKCQNDLLSRIASISNKIETRNIIAIIVIAGALFTGATEAVSYVQGQQVAMLISIPYYCAHYLKTVSPKEKAG